MNSACVYSATVLIEFGLCPQSTPDGASTTSYLTFIPTKDDNGKSLFCRGETPDLKGSAKEDSAKLFVTRKYSGQCSLWRSCARYSREEEREG